MRDVMIDLETLSTRPDAAIVAIGAVTFGPDGIGREFHAAIKPEAVRGHIDPETVAWWMRQSDEARAIFHAGPCQYATSALIELAEMVRGCGSGGRVWGHGSSFDLPIIESLFRAEHLSVPWGYRAPRDTRTILELAGVKVEMPASEKHNALSDARAQALAVIRAAKILGAGRLWPELAATP